MNTQSQEGSPVDDTRADAQVIHLPAVRTSAELMPAEQAPSVMLVATRQAAAGARHGSTLARRGGRYIIASWWLWVWQPEAAQHVKVLRRQAKALVKAANGDAQVKEAARVSAGVAGASKALRERRMKRLAGTIILVGGGIAAGDAGVQALGLPAPLAHLVITVALVLILVVAGYIADDEDDPAVTDVVVAHADPDDPYPLADARTRAEVQECVRRALAATGMDVNTIEEPARHEWGWEIPVVLRSGKPATLIARLDDLETLLDLPAGGLHPHPDRGRRARILLRAVQNDPFMDMPPLLPAEPNTLTIRQPLPMGRSLRGEFLLGLYTQNMLLVAASGAGKSMGLLTIAERLTACADVVVWDVDVSGGGGLDELGDAISRRARTQDEAFDLLGDAAAYAQARPPLFGLVGRHWDVSAERPHLVIVIDEFNRLADESKELGKLIVEIGRKAAVTILVASQMGTKDHLKFDVADLFGIRMLMACRDQDIRAVLGPGFAADGWRPDRLRRRVEGSSDPHDAGCVYVLGGGSHDPILRKFGLLTVEAARMAGQQRAETRTRMDEATVAAAAASRAGGGVSAVDVLAAQAIARTLLEAIPDGADAIPTETATKLTGRTANDLADRLRPCGISPDRIDAADGRKVRGYRRAALQDAAGAL